MKRIVRILTFTLLLLLAACASPEVDERLAAIEQEMESQPDSALVHIGDLSQQYRITHPRQRAWHALLHVQALDKNFIDSTNDPNINIAVEYYDDSNDLHHKMLSFYYLGRIKYNAREYAAALISMTKAYEIAEKNNHYYWMGRASEQIANVYGDNFHSSEAIKYAQLSCECLKKSETQPYINYSLLNLA